MSSANKTARPPNAHLRRVNSAFSGFAGLKLHLFIQSHFTKMGMANLLFSHPHLLCADLLTSLLLAVVDVCLIVASRFVIRRG